MRILIAHGSRSIAESLAVRLAGEHQVLCCTDGEETLRLLEELFPDVLILHLSMPRRDGRYILTRTKNKPPIILVTAYQMDENTQVRLLNMGVYEVMVMPTNALVLDSLRRAIEGIPTLTVPTPLEFQLQTLGFCPSLRGYYQTLQALELLSRDLGQSLYKDIYPKIEGGKSAEKTIRTAIKNAWNHGDRWTWKKYFPGARECPGNKTFLLTLLQADRDWLV